MTIFPERIIIYTFTLSYVGFVRLGIQIAMKILIIDDDLEFIDHVKFLLDGSFDVFTASSPSEAVNILSSDDIEALLLDIDLKAESTGLDLLSK